METKEIQEIQHFILKNVDESKMSKKAFKELKYSIEVVSRNLNRQLLSFKDNYLKDYVDWNIKQLEIRLKELKKN